MGGREEIDRGTGEGRALLLGWMLVFSSISRFLLERSSTMSTREASVSGSIDGRLLPFLMQSSKGKTRLNPSRSATYRVERGQRTKGTALLDHEKLERELKRIPRGCGSRPGTWVTIIYFKIAYFNVTLLWNDSYRSLSMVNSLERLLFS